MQEREITAAVAGRALLAKEEAADLIRATLQELGKQLSGGEVRELVTALPDALAAAVPVHSGRSRPIPLPHFIKKLSERTGLNEEEVTRGVRAILTVLAGPRGGPLAHGMSQLPGEYREMIAETA